MSVDDDNRRRVIQENLVELVNRLSPDELLPHLSCLSRQSQQKIRCRLAQEGQAAATVLLLDDLPRKDNWWEQLIAALDHPAVGQQDLAELLRTQEDTVRGVSKKSEKTELFAEVHKVATQNGGIQAYITKGKAEINWSTPLRKLPFSVVKVLLRLDFDSKWKDLAAQIGYTVEQVNSLEAYIDKDGSHVQKLYRDLQTRYNFSLGQLVIVLQDIERFDILDELSHIKELKHLEFSNRLTPESLFENQFLHHSMNEHIGFKKSAKPILNPPNFPEIPTKNQIKSVLHQKFKNNERDLSKSDCTSNKKLYTCNNKNNHESSLKRIVTALGIITVLSFTLYRCVFR